MAITTARTVNGMRRQRVTAGSGHCRRVGTTHRVPEVDPLEVLKNQLLAEQMMVVRDSDLAARLRRAADESASIAWATAYPLLALPELLREKTAQAHAQFEQQRRIQSRGRVTMQFAA